MSNGRLDTSDLAVIPGGTKMGGSALIRADLLPGLVALQAAYLARFDAPLRPTSAADGYRPYDSQVRAFLGRYAPATSGGGPFSDVRYWQGRRYVRVSGASAAVPGTSNHGWAVACDFADVGATGGDRWDWLMEHAPRFGFVNPLWARDGDPRNGSQEPWHWEGRAVPVSNYRTFLTDLGIEVPGVTTPDPIAPLPVEDPTMWIISAPGRGQAVIGPGYYLHLPNPEYVHAAGALTGIKTVEGNDRQFDLWASIALAGAAPDAVDEQAIAAALAPLVSTQAPQLDDDALARIARAVNDEQARRLAS